jgi:hypothetical protein
MSASSFAFCKPLERLIKIGFVLRDATIDCSRISFYQRNRAQLDGGAQQRGARIGPTYTNPQIE